MGRDTLMTSLIFLIALVPLVASSDDIDDEKIEELMKMFKEKGMGASITMPKRENEKFLRGQAASFCMKFKKQLPRKECKQEIIEALNENSKGLVYMSEAGKNV